jgi:hypothetical protein
LTVRVARWQWSWSVFVASASLPGLMLSDRALGSRSELDSVESRQVS